MKEGYTYLVVTSESPLRVEMLEYRGIEISDGLVHLVFHSAENSSIHSVRADLVKQFNAFKIEGGISQ